jgi:hypothetical protein
MHTSISPEVVDTSPDAVRKMHATMYRRLRRQMNIHRPQLNEAGWDLLTKVAFALYVDSREETWQQDGDLTTDGIAHTSR